jgi:hypothetical protein
MIELESNFELMKEYLSENGSGWIFWPKQASEFITDPNQHEVRNYGLAQGYVDYKVCSLNDFVNGLKFPGREK